MLLIAAAPHPQPPQNRRHTKINSNNHHMINMTHIGNMEYIVNYYVKKVGKHSHTGVSTLAYVKNVMKK